MCGLGIGDGFGDGFGDGERTHAATVSVEFLAVGCFRACYAAAGVIVGGVEAVGVFGCAGFFPLDVHFASA